MNEREWQCTRCEGVVECAFCECCALHCTALRPNALQAHRRQGKIFVAPWPRFDLGDERLSVGRSALFAYAFDTTPDGSPIP